MASTMSFMLLFLRFTSQIRIPLLAFYTGSLNYNHAFNSWFDISAGVYRYQVHPSLADTLLRNFTYGDLTLGIDWRLIYSKISVGTLLSDENQTYFQIRNSRYFQTPEFSRKKFYISFDPYINLLLGPRYKIESHYRDIFGKLSHITRIRDRIVKIQQVKPVLLVPLSRQIQLIPGILGLWRLISAFLLPSVLTGISIEAEGKLCFTII